MKSGTQVALVAGAGYLMGRRHRRMALVLGTAALAGKSSGLTGELRRQGRKLAESGGPLGKVSPELAEVAEMVRGDLRDAGKAAALTAVRGRLDRMSDKLHDQAQALRQATGQDSERAGSGARRSR